MRIAVYKLGRHLIGRIAGRRHFARLCELCADVPPGNRVVLDFDSVTQVSGSWINAALIPFLRWAADPENDLFPILGGVKDEWLDEIEMVAEWNHLVFLVACDASDSPRAVRLFGDLDRAQQDTLGAVLELREVTGASLERWKKGQHVKATAWNNRLRDLYEKRLLIRRENGRERVYFPVAKEIQANG